MTESTSSVKTDFEGREGIEKIVDLFYGRIRQDDLLGFIFDDVAKVNWTSHLPKMYNFWDTILFRTGVYRGNPVNAHAQLAPLTRMGQEQFNRWLELFCQTVDELYAGENAERIKKSARDMAALLHAKVNHVRDERFDPANLTPEQRERYAAYREAAKTIA